MDFSVVELVSPCASITPCISEQTVSFHHKKHHQAYYDNLNTLINNTSYAKMDLISIIRVSYEKKDGPIFNNAGQLYNHNFLWASLTANSNPSERVLDLIKRDFASIHEFKDKCKAHAKTHFGSGWSWAIYKNGMIAFMNTSNAEPAFLYNCTPLCVLDLWEHAYYLDYQNRRNDHIDALVDNLINWDLIESQLEYAGAF